MERPAFGDMIATGVADLQLDLQKFTSTPWLCHTFQHLYWPPKSCGNTHTSKQQGVTLCSVLHQHMSSHLLCIDMHSVAGGVDVSLLKEAVSLVNGKVDTEASGNVTIDTVRSIAETGVTYISCGALTHSFQALDISLKIALL